MWFKVMLPSVKVLVFLGTIIVKGTAEFNVIIDGSTPDGPLDHGSTVPLGTNVTLVCKVTEMPNDTAPMYMYIWSCPNRQTCNTQNNILIIPVVSTNDGGDYSCTVLLLINEKPTQSYKFTFTAAVPNVTPTMQLDVTPTTQMDVTPTMQLDVTPTTLSVQPSTRPFSTPPSHGSNSQPVTPTDNTIALAVTVTVVVVLITILTVLFLVIMIVICKRKWSKKHTLGAASPGPTGFSLVHNGPSHPNVYLNMAATDPPQNGCTSQPVGTSYYATPYMDRRVGDDGTESYYSTAYAEIGELDLTGESGKQTPKFPPEQIYEMEHSSRHSPNVTVTLKDTDNHLYAKPDKKKNTTVEPVESFYSQPYTMEDILGEPTASNDYASLDDLVELSSNGASSTVPQEMRQETHNLVKKVFDLESFYSAVAKPK